MGFDTGSDRTESIRGQAARKRAVADPACRSSPWSGVGYVRTCVRDPPRAPHTRTSSGRSERRNVMVAWATAAELPQVELGDALALVLLALDYDAARFDRAAVRWHARLCREAPLTLDEAQLALAALGCDRWACRRAGHGRAHPNHPGARLEPHGRGATEVDWLGGHADRVPGPGSGGRGRVDPRIPRSWRGTRRSGTAVREGAASLERVRAARPASCATYAPADSALPRIARNRPVAARGRCICGRSHDDAGRAARPAVALRTRWDLAGLEVLSQQRVIGHVAGFDPLHVPAGQRVVLDVLPCQ
jgi:hypothetical protein